MFSDVFKLSRAKGDRLLHSLFLTHWGQPVSLAADKTTSLSTLPSAEVSSLLQNLPAVWWSDSRAILRHQHSFFICSYVTIRQWTYLKTLRWYQDNLDSFSVLTLSSVLKPKTSNNEWCNDVTSSVTANSTHCSCVRQSCPHSRRPRHTSISAGCSGGCHSGSLLQDHRSAPLEKGARTCNWF